MWVPVEVREESDDMRGAAPLFGAPTKATAQFSTFRRLSIPTADQPAASPPVLPTYSAELAELLRRLGDYVAEYERSFSDLVAEETYAQRVAPWAWTEDARGRQVMVKACTVCKRTTRADLVFVRLTGEVPWASYRDVFEVDGRRVREHEQRLVKLLSNPSADAQEQARKLLEASATYNIGPVKRTVNLPTLPLLFLLPRNQERFEFRLGGRRMIGTTEAIELVFRETSRPTFVKGPLNADLPAQGRFWVNALRAAVVRSEVEFAFKRGGRGPCDHELSARARPRDVCARRDEGALRRRPKREGEDVPGPVQWRGALRAVPAVSPCRPGRRWPCRRSRRVLGQLRERSRRRRRGVVVGSGWGLRLR
jgi:hypothetical protein